MLDMLSNAQLGAAVAVVVAAVPLFQIFYTSLLPKPIPGVPHNPVTSIWGDIPQIIKVSKHKTFGEHLADEVEKHGPIFQMIMGRRKFVVLSDHAEVERILVHGKSVEQSRWTNQIFATVMPLGQISLPTNKMWKRHRRLTGPSMSQRYLDKMSARIYAGASNLTRLWNAKVNLVGTGAFDVKLDLQLATMDIIISVMISASGGSIDAAYNSLPSSLPSSAAIAHIPPPPTTPLHASVRAMIASVERLATAPFPFLAARLEWISPTWRKHYTYLNTFFDNKIAEARKNVEDMDLVTDADCVVDMAVQREEQEGMSQMGREELVDELMTYIIGGQDTTASALAWHVKFMAQDPDIQRQLHDEVCAVFGQDGELNFEAIDDSDRVPILEAVTAETLRRGQVGVVLSRTFIDDEVILGRAIPKNSHLFIPNAVMSNQQSSWGSDVKTWNPRRWLTPDGSFNRNAGPNIPFGLGLRACFGQKLATRQIKVLVATLSRDFFFKEVPEQVRAFDAVELVTRQPKKCYVSLERWDQKS